MNIACVGPYVLETLDYAQPGGLADFFEGGGMGDSVFATEGPRASVDNDLKVTRGTC
jgi:hypothetical protein